MGGRPCPAHRGFDGLDRVRRTTLSGVRTRSGPESRALRGASGTPVRRLTVVSEARNQSSRADPTPALSGVSSIAGQSFRTTRPKRSRRWCSRRRAVGVQRLAIHQRHSFACPPRPWAPPAALPHKRARRRSEPGSLTGVVARNWPLRCLNSGETDRKEPSSPRRLVSQSPSSSAQGPRSCQVNHGGTS